jgi:hypothetical protein
LRPTGGEKGNFHMKPGSGLCVFLQIFDASGG